VHTRVAIVYNKPFHSRYDAVGEEKAVLSVLEAVEAVHQALLELGYHVILVPLLPPLEPAEGELRALHTDLVFNLFEGFCGYPETEALVPEVLSEMGMPCTGCPGPVLRLALNKAKAKTILKDALTRVAILSNEKFKGITLEVSPESLRICTHNPDHDEAEEELAIEYSGDPLSISFNAQYLLDAVSNLDSEHAVLTIASNASSCIIDEPNVSVYKFIVMPMRI